MHRICLYNICKKRKNNITLNEENIDYKWCDIKEFIEKIQWYGDKKELYNVLKEALDKKIYFKTEKIENFMYLQIGELKN